MIFNHHRFQIWNQNQHPFIHNLSDFGYSNPALPGVINMEGALNFIVAVLYPNSKEPVANPASLPLTGNTINDYRVVLDDGDQKSAGYRWEQREGEATPSWHKINDFDWGSDSILQAWQNRTQDLFFMRYGYDDIDQAGSAVTGLFAGQRVYGGKSAHTNLTLSANSGDGVGPNTGFIQFTDPIRPTVSHLLDLGTDTERWSTGWFTTGVFDTLSITSGSIDDSTGYLNFNFLNLATSGTLTVGNFLIDGAVNKIISTAGIIDFDNEDITTLGSGTFKKITAVNEASSFKAGTQIADFVITNGNIQSASSEINLNSLNLLSTGFAQFGLLSIDNVKIDGNSISTTNANGNLLISANGLGVIALSSPLATSSQVVIQNLLSVNGLLEIDNIQIDGNSISATNNNGNLYVVPHGTGQTFLGGHVAPVTNGVNDLGLSSNKWKKLWIDGSIGHSEEILITDLLSLKNATYRDTARTVLAQTGDSLFWNGSEWLASKPDTEIFHNSISGLNVGDAGHTQFALLSGRNGGQELIGGVDASENLNLESTQHTSKGFIQTKSTIRPYFDSVYNLAWSGLDIGHSNFRYNDFYSVGEFKGFRLENLETKPSSSSQKRGRLIYVLDDENVYVDTGTSIKQVGGARFYIDTIWNGVETVKDISISGIDARLAIWQLKDNNNDFECLFVEIRSTSSNNVRITVGSPLPAGSYRLVGV